MKNEPVAYACQIVEADFETNILKIEMLDENYKVSAGIKYLCDTHPVKELTLTNDEIREIGDECILNNNGILNWLDFARAILKKASEK